jgi:penicillin-binding protein 1A
MALPIWGLYMSKVYADKTLPYSQDEVFELPEDYNPCRSKANTVEEPATGGFDELFQ